MKNLGDWAEEIAHEERAHPPVHPGEVLKQEWLEPLGLNVDGLAEALGVDRRYVHGIVNGERAITEGTALRLARWSGMRTGFWLGLQSDHDLRAAKRS